VDYITGPLLKPEEAEIYFIPGVAKAPESVNKHCIKAIERSLSFGSHGLPLIGAGDWNDGMNRVGVNGKGESVWLGWFMYTVLDMFTSFCKTEKNEDKKDRYMKIAKEIIENIEKHAWDGQWYLRAFFDDGSPLGSEKNQECKIDSISQSWGIISGAADITRGLSAIQSGNRHLVKEEDGVICLLTPPFDDAPMDPGYIKGYYPGVRENGGQYTHAAIWLAMAHVRLRDGEGAYKLLSMINPINITSTFKGLMKYEQEPYAVSADVYSKEPYVGKGGWSWYTGSAGWMYQALTYDVLGIKKIGNRLHIDPTIPSDWKEYTIDYKYKNTKYVIIVENPDKLTFGCESLMVDNDYQIGNSFELIDDGASHIVNIKITGRYSSANDFFN
jgi:cyclic beta-1,2-glucan synthetase